MNNTIEELKRIIVAGLRIEDRTPADFADDEPLLESDLGIDSIDILQLILEIERRFGIKLVEGEFDGGTWRTIRTLAAAVDARVAARS